MRENYLDFSQTSCIPRTDHDNRYFHTIKQPFLTVPIIHENCREPLYDHY